MREYTNSEMRGLINEHIHNEKHRRILLLRYIDGLTYERIAEAVGMSTQQVKNIIYKAQQRLIRFL